MRNIEDGESEDGMNWFEQNQRDCGHAAFLEQQRQQEQSRINADNAARAERDRMFQEQTRRDQESWRASEELNRRLRG